jgi:hypothetical protein
MEKNCDDPLRGANFQGSWPKTSLIKTALYSGRAVARGPGSSAA